MSRFDEYEVETSEDDQRDEVPDGAPDGRATSRAQRHVFMRNRPFLDQRIVARFEELHKKDTKVLGKQKEINAIINASVPRNAAYGSEIEVITRGAGVREGGVREEGGGGALSFTGHAGVTGGASRPPGPPWVSGGARGGSSRAGAAEMHQTGFLGGPKNKLFAFLRHSFSSARLKSTLFLINNQFFPLHADPPPHPTPGRPCVAQVKANTVTLLVRNTTTHNNTISKTTMTKTEVIGRMCGGNTSVFDSGIISGDIKETAPGQCPRIESTPYYVCVSS